MKNPYTKLLFTEAAVAIVGFGSALVFYQGNIPGYAIAGIITYIIVTSWRGINTIRKDMQD
jgi:hypothetical protein